MAAAKKKTEVAAEAASVPSQPAMVLCRIHTGNYWDDRIYTTGDEVMVAVEELEKLAHCLAPAE